MPNHIPKRIPSKLQDVLNHKGHYCFNNFSITKRKLSHKMIVFNYKIPHKFLKVKNIGLGYVLKLKKYRNHFNYKCVVGLQRSQRALKALIKEGQEGITANVTSK